MKFTVGGNRKLRDEQGKQIPGDWPATWTGWLIAVIVFTRVIARGFQDERAIYFMGLTLVVMLILFFVFLKKIIQKREWDWAYPVGAFILLYITKNEIAYVCSTYL